MVMVMVCDGCGGCGEGESVRVWDEGGGDACVYSHVSLKPRKVESRFPQRHDKHA